ncbi:MAG: class I SAM-dependent methyltransferase [candidate division Zixibacteria bacterium]|nr:class I SAM-dependent methyltransferase [candidate division Zixibacteria bacterium]
MANFQPMKDYMFSLLDELIVKYKLKPPFLDAGCGGGDVVLHLARKGWNGKGIDFSPEAISIAERNLQPFSDVRIERRDVFSERGSYSTIILWDVLEHVEKDSELLSVLSQNLSTRVGGGYLIISVPTNKKEWRWDDKFYGHYRRYDRQEIKDLLSRAGFEVKEYWDFTFPVFWLMRRLYTWLLKDKSLKRSQEKEELTKISTLNDAWDIGRMTFIVNWKIWWKPVFFLQRRFRRTNLGHEALILAQKVSTER